MKRYRVLPEYYDLWAATEDNDVVTEEFVEQMTTENEWNLPKSELLEQLEEIED
jgi:hypothetical protein